MRIEIASSMPGRLRGLLGRQGFLDALLLVPCNDVHTYGMKKPIDIAFISREGKVVESYRAIEPHRRLRCRQAKATLERFATDDPWFKCGDKLDSRLLHEKASGKDVYLSFRAPR